MCIKQDLDTELVGFPDDISEFFNIRVIILSFFGFDALPCNMEPDMIESPVFKVVQIDVSKWIIGVEGLSIGIEWKSFVDGVDAVKDGSAVVLIDEERRFGVDTKGCDGGE